MIQDIEAIGSQALTEVQGAKSLSELENIRISVLGKKGRLSEALKGMKDVPASERPAVGKAVNDWKRKIESALGEQGSRLQDQEISNRVASERIDVTQPARIPHHGALHPVTLATRRVVRALSRIGFDVTTGPEADTEYMNFEAVNIPKDHPARDMQDTFFLGPGVLLRTHTTPVQMRTMLRRKWPVRILCPGAVYRCDNDATHSPMFHQVEGLWVDRHVSMSDLKGTLEFFAQEVFGSKTQIRLRPSYFPFVEPGAEVDVSCMICKGKNSDSCKVCKGTGWLEILGAGMVHRRLYEAAGYKKTDNISGFAFGMGLERIAMLLYGIPDIRLMFQGDVRFLSQFH